MADEAAVLDAPVLDVVDDVVEPVAEETAEATEVQEQPAEVEGDARTEPKWLRNMKATDPEGYKDAKAKFHTLRSLDEKLKDFDLDGTKSFLEEHGGRESLATALTELQTKANELDAINQAIGEGKTEILDRIPADSLAKLAPAVAQKWAEADPEGWGRAMSGIMAATIQSSGVPMFLERIGMFLEFGKTEEAKQAIAQLGEWAGNFQKQAAAPVTARPSKAPDVTQERQQWEHEKFTTQLTEVVESARTQEIEKSLETFISRRPKDVDAKELAIANVRQKVLERLNGDQEFKKSVNALIARRDKDGAARLIKARESKAIEEIAPKVGRTIFGQPAAAVVKPAPVVKKAAPVTTGRVDPRDAIFARVLAR